MPVPRILKYKPVSDKKTVKSNVIIRQLIELGYDIYDARAAIKIIEDNNLDKSQFDFPYGSFEEFKKHVLAGEFDIDLDIKSMFVTKEQDRQIMDDIEKGGRWVY